MNDTRFWTSTESPGLDLLSATYTDQVFARHTHDQFVIGLNISGVQGFDHRGSKHVAPAGTIVVINPGDVHTGYSEVREPWVYRGFYPTIESLAEISSDWNQLHFKSSVFVDHDLFRLLMDAHTASERGTDRLAASSLYAFAVRMFFERYSSPRVPSRRFKSGDDRLLEARTILLDRLTENLTLPDLATAVGLSPYHLLRSFRRRFGLPPHLFRIQHRVLRARGMISSGHSLAAAAFQCGFTDQSHMSRWFRRFIGVTPGQVGPRASTEFVDFRIARKA